MSEAWKSWRPVWAAGVAIATIALGISSVPSGGSDPTPARSDSAPAQSASPLPTATTGPSQPIETASSQPSASAIATAPVAGSAKDPETYQTALSELATLDVIPRRGPTDYVRSAFGDSWIDTDGDGCNQRDDVLLRDAVPGTARVKTSGSCDHDVVAGTWIDPYTKTVHAMTDMHELSQALAVQIDHVVPLAEAWASGADAWSLHRRELFANDLGELLAVDGSTNESKGDGDPAAWRPRKAYQCAYAEHWIAVKSKWDLGADTSEVNALHQMLGYC